MDQETRPEFDPSVANHLNVDEFYSGTVDGNRFDSVNEIDLGSGDDIALIQPNGYMDFIDGSDGSDDIRINFNAWNVHSRIDLTGGQSGELSFPGQQEIEFNGFESIYGEKLGVDLYDLGNINIIDSSGLGSLNLTPYDHWSSPVVDGVSEDISVLKTGDSISINNEQEFIGFDLVSLGHGNDDVIVDLRHQNESNSGSFAMSGGPGVDSLQIILSTNQYHQIVDSGQLDELQNFVDTSSDGSIPFGDPTSDLVLSLDNLDINLVDFEERSYTYQDFENFEGTDSADIVDVYGLNQISYYSNESSVDALVIGDILLNDGSDNLRFLSNGKIDGIANGGDDVDIISSIDRDDIVEIDRDWNGILNGNRFTSFEGIDLRGGNDKVTLEFAGAESWSEDISGIAAGAGEDTLLISVTEEFLEYLNESSQIDSFNSFALGASENLDLILQGGESFFLSDFENVVLESQPPINENVGSSSDNQVQLTGQNSGVIDGTTFSDIQDIDLKAGNDTVTVENNSYFDGVLDGGSGIDKLVFNTNDLAGHIRVEEGGVINSLSGSNADLEPIYQNFEVIELLGGDDIVDVLAYHEDADINNLSSYEIDGGDGFDDIHIDLSDVLFAQLGQGEINQLRTFIDDPNGKVLDIDFGSGDLKAENFERAFITQSFADFDSFSSDLHSSIIGINATDVDVDGSATVQTPVVLNSDSSASVVSGDAKAVADTTSIEGITDSSFDIASDLDMAASVQSTLDSSATSTSGIALSSSLIGAQQGIELIDAASGDDAIEVGGIANISVGSSMSAASVAETVGDGTGNRIQGGDGSWSTAIADDHLGLGSGDLGGILGIDVASDASISSSLASSLSADATADAGFAGSNVALNASTGMEDLAVEVGGLGLVSSINQSELDSTASSTTDDTSAIGLNELASGILNSDFNFSDVDSVMSAQTVSELDVEASTTTGDAWSSLDSASVGFEGATSSITGAAEITAIASDQGFAESATIAGQATAMADQSAIGMDGYSINNSSGLQLTALAEVDSTADSSATMV